MPGVHAYYSLLYKPYRFRLPMERSKINTNNNNYYSDYKVRHIIKLTL